MSRGPSGVSACLPTHRLPQPLTYQALRTKRRLGIAHRHAVCFTGLGVTKRPAAGVQSLRDLVAEGVEIVACSGIVSELSQREPQSKRAALALASSVRRPRR